MAKIKYSAAAVEELLNAVLLCDGGEVDEVDHGVADFYAASTPQFQVQFDDGKCVAILLTGSAEGTQVRPAIPVTVAQVRALMDLDKG